MSVTAPKGFRAAGITAGLKPSGQPDLALVVNDGPIAAAAGVFTRNRVVAAAVPWTRQVLRDGECRAVVLNAGSANAFTGKQGFLDVHATAEKVGKALGISAADVAICQTGVIGVPLAMPLMFAGIDAAAQALGTDGGTDAAVAIMTTDNHPKQAFVQGAGWSVGAMGKGAAMLAPSLATMLVVLTTDAVSEAATLDDVLRAATRVTFDRVDVDGCTSTNDTVLLLASGASSVEPPKDQLAQAVLTVCRDLAQQMINDAEGATKSVTIEVSGAATEDDAVAAARAVGRDSLVKCALAGSDPNWGRVVAALGMSTAAFDPGHIEVAMNGVTVCTGGGEGVSGPVPDLSAREVTISIDLHEGSDRGWVWTTDLTQSYVALNSDYTT